MRTCITFKNTVMCKAELDSRMMVTFEECKDITQHLILFTMAASFKSQHLVFSQHLV